MRPALPAYTVLLVTFLLLTGCATIKSDQRISTGVVAMQYNSIGAQYMQRPTFSSIMTLSDGSEFLEVQMDMYGNQSSRLWFIKSRSNEYIALIDKYLSWEKLASSRRDMISKEIGRAEGGANGGKATLKFGFFSGNESTHYLSITFCAVGTCLNEQAQYFSPSSATTLRAALADYGLGKIDTSDRSEIYQ